MLEKNLEECLNNAFKFAHENDHEFVTTEHLLLFMLSNQEALNLLLACQIDIESLEKALNKKAIKENMPMQMGDVVATASDSSLLEYWIKYKPSTTIESGIHQFVKWYKSFYNIV